LGKVQHVWEVWEVLKKGVHGVQFEPPFIFIFFNNLLDLEIMFKSNSKQVWTYHMLNHKAHLWLLTKRWWTTPNLVGCSLMNSPPPTPCHTSMLIIKNNEYHVNHVLFDHKQPWNLWLFSPLNECSSTNNFLCQLFTNKHVSLALLLTSEQLPPRPFFSQGTCGMFKLGSNMSPPKPQV
jgi:hypothetical protein